MSDFRDRILDRVVQFDERSRGFSALAGLTIDTFRSYTWSCDVYNDQRREGACVGFAWSHELSARPAVYRVDEAFALDVFHVARAKFDQWPGEDYDGTSVIAGVKATMEHLNSKGLSLYGGYRWAFGVQEVLQVIGYLGPVVLGINWYENMYYPDEHGFISVSGPIAGGHAILANGVKIVRHNTSMPATWDNIDLDRSFVRLHNSWGTGYGIGGDAFVTVRDLEKLMQADGEACIPTYRRY